MKAQLDKKSSLSIQILEIVIWLLFACGMFFKCMYLQSGTGLNTAVTDPSINFRMAIVTIASVLIITGAILLFSNKKRYILLMIVDILLSVLLMFDIIYFRYYKNVLTVPCIAQLGLVGSTGDSISSLFKLNDLVFFADIIPLVIILVMICLARGNKLFVKLKLNVRLAISLFLIAVGTVTMVWFNDGIGKGVFRFDNNYAVKRMGVFYSHCQDVGQFFTNIVFGDKSLNDDEISQITDFLRDPLRNTENTANGYTGTQAGKNLVIIQLEAIQNFLLFSEINGHEVTPNLNRLANESLYFKNTFFQIAGGNTSDAEFVINNSLYPAGKGSVYFLHPSNRYHSLPLIMKNEGYKTIAAHANDADFWNRRVMYGNIGFDNYYIDEDYDLDEIVGWGLSDVSFFRQTLDKLKGEDPFYAFLITLSSHHPYAMFNNYEFDTGKYEGTMMGNYLKASHYLDKSIGAFFEQLKEDGLDKDTLVVIVGDHFGMTKDDFGMVADYLGVPDNPYEWIMNQEVPLIIHGDGIEPAVIEKICAQVDIMPTIANLMGLDSPYTLGKDLLSDLEGYAVLRDGTVITDEYIWLVRNDTLYAYESGKELDYRLFSEEIQKIQNELAISDLVLYKNAFEKIKLAD